MRAAARKSSAVRAWIWERVWDCQWLGGEGGREGSEEGREEKVWTGLSWEGGSVDDEEEGWRQVFVRWARRSGEEEEEPGGE